LPQYISSTIPIKGRSGAILNGTIAVFIMQIYYIYLE
jgi:hypothetical protein